MNLVLVSTHVLRIVALVIVTLPFTQAALAQSTWPNKSIKLIVPFPPGGGTDTFARPLAAQMSKDLGQQVVIENKGGAGGTIGAAIAAKSPSDGYTIFMGAVHHTVAESIYKNLPYNLEKDLIPIRGVAFVPDVIVVNNKLPIQSVKESPLATSNSPTFGRSNSPRQDGLIINQQCHRAQGARWLL